MKLKKANDGVSEILSTVLLLGMAISFFSLLCITVLSYPSSSHSPSANLVGTIEIKEEYIEVEGKEGKYIERACILIEHRGGEALSLDTKVIITIGDSMPETITVRDEIDDEAKEDNLWGIGEWFTYQDPDISGKQVEITVVDVESNSIIMTGSLQGP